MFSLPNVINRDKRSSRSETSMMHPAFLSSSSPSMVIRFSSIPKHRRFKGSIQQIGKRFLFALAAVSVILDKITLCSEEELVDFGKASTYFWLPSIFALDILFLALLFVVGVSHHAASQFGSLCCMVLLTTISITASVLSAYEVTFLIGHHDRIPWTMAPWALAQWDQFEALIKFKAEEVFIKVWMVSLVQYVWSFLLTFCSEILRVKRWRKKDSTSSMMTSSSRAKKRIKAGLLLCYFLLVPTTRPAVPYNELSRTPFFAVPMDIFRGIKVYSRERAQTQQMRSDPIEHEGQRIWNAAPFLPLNVVLIFLETVRADMMPFNGTTGWAERFVPNENLRDKITPFYANWTKLPTTLFFPLIKSASGFTHKSLVSTLCSLYALPMKGTVEHKHNLYHLCLPQILDKYGYSLQFFKSLTSRFDHQYELMQSIGFPNMFGKQEYEKKYKPSLAFRWAHTANYFGYDDDIMVEPMMNWVDNKRNQSSPFFLTYLSGITHDPYGLPPRVSWNATKFSNDAKANGYLNEVSYLDRFLRNVIDEFDKRHLLNSTLFVILGDHGGNFRDRGGKFTTLRQRYEESFNVGVSFHTEHKQLAKLLWTKNQHTNGNWSSVDVLPTILELLNMHHGNFSPLNGKDENEESLVDGRSMLHSSGRRLLLSIANPGDTVVLRDWPYLLVHPNDGIPEIYDVKIDPNQRNPLYLNSNMKASSHENPEMVYWGKMGAEFVKRVKLDLVEAYRTGKRCENCTLSLLSSLESLDQWNVPSSTTFPVAPNVSQ